MISNRKLKWQVLPVAFRATDVMNLFGLDTTETTKTLYRWIRDGHISRLSKRLDVYVNNVKCEHEELRIPLMLKKLNPLSIYCGPSIFNAYGWSTQYSQITYCMLPGLTKDINIEERAVVLLRRPHRWWKAMSDFMVNEDSTSKFGSRHLKPEALLAEALMTTYQNGNEMDLWSPDVDDLYFNEIDDSVTDVDWYKAFAAVANFYKKTLPLPGPSKQHWYEKVKHLSPPQALNLPSNQDKELVETMGPL